MVHVVLKYRTPKSNGDRFASGHVAGPLACPFRAPSFSLQASSALLPARLGRAWSSCRLSASDFAATRRRAMEVARPEAHSFFWRMPISPDLVFFVDSPASFAAFSDVLDRAVLVGLDAEWKPLVSRSGQTASKMPRVSILQVACRLPLPIQFEGRFGQLLETRESTHNEDDRAHKGYSGPGELVQEQNRLLEDLNSASHSQEAVYILDMLALPPDIFAYPLQKMLQSKRTLKLGYALRDDMRFLAASFPGVHCFDEVEPYVDLGRMYRNIRLDKGHESTKWKHHRRPSAIAGGGLSGVVQSVIGQPLCKELQCSNWEERPLSPEQLEYAAADAFCLMDVFEKLTEEITGQNPIRPSVGLAELLDVSLSDYVSHTSTESGVSVHLVASRLREYTFRPFNARPGENATAAAEAAGVLLARRSICTEGLRTESVKAGGRSQSNDGILRVAVDECEEVGCDTHEERTEEGNCIWNPTWRVAIEDFGERLSIHETKHVSLPRKNRRRKGPASGIGQTKEQEGLIEWVGPAPWDQLCGGDGVPRFLCDTMVEGLARQLRCVGIDAASTGSKKIELRQMVEKVEAEGRVLLTRDVKLVRRRIVPPQLVFYVKNLGKQDQLREIITAFRLEIQEDQLLSRCIRCNGLFNPTPLSSSEALAAAVWTQVLPPCALKNVSEFWQCSVCRHLYWEGSQFDRALHQFASVCHIKGSGVSSIDSSAAPGKVEVRLPCSAGPQHDNTLESTSTPGQDNTRTQTALLDHEGSLLKPKGPRGKSYVCGCKRSSEGKKGWLSKSSPLLSLH